MTTPMPMFVGAAVLSIAAWLVVLGLVLLPRLAHLARRERLIVLLAPQCFRHISILLVMPGFALPTIPAHWVQQTIGGDVLTAVLAMLAIVLLRRGHRHAYKVAWAASVIGILDLMKNVVYAMILGVPSHMLIATAIPTMGVPLMFVAHILAIRLLIASDDGP